MAVLYRQQPTHFGKWGYSLLLFFRCWNTHWLPWQSCHFQVWNCRRCGQRLWPCCEFFFLPCLYVIRENYFMSMKISHYTVSCLLTLFHTLLPFSLPLLPFPILLSLCYIDFTPSQLVSTYVHDSLKTYSTNILCTYSSMYINTKVTKHKKFNWRMDRMARQQEVRVTWW